MAAMDLAIGVQGCWIHGQLCQVLAGRNLGLGFDSMLALSFFSKDFTDLGGSDNIVFCSEYPGDCY